MEVFKICGPTTLSGSVCIQGSKNAVLPMMAAAVVAKDVTVLENCPDIGDVHSAIKILQDIGCKAEYHDGTLTIDSSGEVISHISEETMARLRASFVFTGALAARCGRFSVTRPGGCNIGMRPVDIHLEAFKILGADITMTSEGISCKADKLAPRDVTLRFPSVGATENIMILASTLKGTTRIINAAREPEIEDLQNLLNKMGALITGAGSSVIVIKGKGELGGARYRVMPDRIDVATYITAVACNKGSLLLKDANPAHVLSFINILKKCGLDITTAEDTIYVEKKNRLKGNIRVNTMPYPGFATDMQSLMMTAMCFSEGISLIRENIFENRFCLASALVEMGADIRIYRRTASVRGVRKLTPVDGCVCDLRSGASLAVAMMACEGASHLSNICYIDRGYERFASKYKSLGADIERIEKI